MKLQIQFSKLLGYRTLSSQPTIGLKGAGVGAKALAVGVKGAYAGSKAIPV